MKHKRRIFLPAAALTLLALAIVLLVRPWHARAPKKPETIPQGDYSYTVDYAKFRLRQLMKQHHLPGVALAMVDDQQIVWQGAIGLANVEQRVPATEKTVYKLWSVAKAFTALETMRLVDEGLVELDAPITDYLPGFAIQTRFPDAQPITIRSLLTHHSGLPRNECQHLDRGATGTTTLRRVVESLKDCWLAYSPGTRFKYSNVGVDTLGRIVEIMRGESFAAYMSEHILEPTGMESSAFVASGIPANREIAPGYEYWKGDYYPIEQGDIVKLASGNLYSTVEDMGAFLQFLFRDGKTGARQLIEPETLELMFQGSGSGPTDPMPMGLGWKTARILGAEHLVWHDGGPTDGTGTFVAFLPERKLGIVLISNQTNFEAPIPAFLAVELFELMIETKDRPAAATETATERVEVDRSLLQGYVGRYAAYGQLLDVTRSGNRLKGTMQGMTFDLVPVGDATFQVSHWLLKLGLGSLLPIPPGLEETRIRFRTGDDPAEDLLILSVADFAYEVCPRVLDLTEDLALWAKVAGDYDLVYRMPGGRAGSEILGQTSIRIEEGVLQMDGYVGPMWPVSETQIIILSGSFAGETMVYDPGTGEISHQSIVYRPR